MGKIFKNMLPYWKWILVIVAFLAMQAFCDLSLPQYTSDIIDVGITYPDDFLGQMMGYGEKR